MEIQGSLKKASFLIGGETIKSYESGTLTSAEKEVLQARLDAEKKVLNRLEKYYKEALDEIGEKIAAMLGRQDADLPNVINRIEYQRLLKGQVQSALDKLHSNEYETIEKYLEDSYTDAFVGAMYSLHDQGIPIIIPIDQNTAIKAVTVDTRLSKPLYASLGVDIQRLKTNISAEITRGIAASRSYSEMARNLAAVSRIPIGRARTIVRTEAGRIQEQAIMDSAEQSKKKGADVVKQWCAILDMKTRDSHRRLDMQIRELEEYFELGSLKAKHPGSFGDPAEDCNCRCTTLIRARAALDEDELEELKARAEYFKLDKTDSFEEFKGKYLKTTEAMEDADGEFDIFKFLEENDDAFVMEEVPPIQYPDDLLFTKKEQNILDGLNAYYENPDLPMSKWPKNYKIPTDAERLAMNGKLTSDFVSIERQRLQMQVSNAEEMIRQRKAEGYKFDKTAAIARREMNRELSYEEGHLVIGKDGIRHWQNSRKHALEALEELEFAEKLQRRYAFTNAAGHLEKSGKLML